jgi:hypothetical protein
VKQLAPGLWRWSVPHPDWQPHAKPGSPADWEQEVGSVLYETEDAAVFFDPLVPPSEDVFWRWADERVAGRCVVVLTTIAGHRRSRAALVERYGASTSRAKRSLPNGVAANPIRGAGETIFWLSEHRALIPGDRILGAAGGGLRLCPESWLRYLPSKLTRAELEERVRPLLELPIERVLVSHGQPVLRGGAKALARALAAE